MANNITTLLQSTNQWGVTPGEKLVSRVPIGQGSFGTVYLAKHTDWGPVAFKRLSENEFIDRSCVDNLIKEVWAHHQLRHPNIVQMMAVVHTPQVELGIVIWYEKYGNAYNFINTYQVPLAWKTKMIHEVILGLTYLHTLSPPIIHADIKLSNVLVGEAYVAKISDFGLSVWKEYTTLKSHHAHSLKGTVSHIAPELLRDITHRVNELTDVYSLGIFMWELIAQKSPYSGHKEVVIMEAVKEGQRPSLDLLPVDIPSALLDIIKDCWSHEYTRRPRCQELKLRFDELEDVRIIELSKIQLQKQEASKQEKSLLSPSGSCCFPVTVDSKPPSTFSPGVDHQLDNVNTNPLCPQQATSSGEICALQCEDHVKDHSSGNPFRYDAKHCYNVNDHLPNSTESRDPRSACQQVVLSDASPTTQTTELQKMEVASYHSSRLNIGKSQTMPCISGRTKTRGTSEIIQQARLRPSSHQGESSRDTSSRGAPDVLTDNEQSTRDVAAQMEFDSMTNRSPTENLLGVEEFAALEALRLATEVQLD